MYPGYTQQCSTNPRTCPTIDYANNSTSGNSSAGGNNTSSNGGNNTASNGGSGGRNKIASYSFNVFQNLKMKILVLI